MWREQIWIEDPDGDYIDISLANVIKIRDTKVEIIRTDMDD